MLKFRWLQHTEIGFEDIKGSTINHEGDENKRMVEKQKTKMEGKEERKDEQETK
jgi:hypothetical protein